MTPLERKEPEGAETVRKLRVRLADALSISSPGDGEVLAQLERALTEPGTDPPAWEIYRAIGSVHLRQQDLAGAVIDLTKAISSAPDGTETVAGDALQLLARPDSAELAMTVSPEDVVHLLSVIQACRSKPIQASLFAARLSRLRGDVPAALATLEPLAAASDPIPTAIVEELAATLMDLDRAGDALKYLQRATGASSVSIAVLRLQALIDVGDFVGALTAADAALSEPSVPAMKALALAGLGKLAEAFRAIASAPQSRDTALVEAILRLEGASRGGSAPDLEMVQLAEMAASTAARTAPADPDGLFMVAQVNLEGSLDLDEGRRLLSHAIKRMSRAPERSRWFRYQQRTRSGNSWFQYFQIELAAALEADDDVLNRAEAIDTQNTTIAQDAAIAMLVGAVYKKRGDTARAAERFSQASVSYDRAGNLAQALTAARGAFSAEATSQRAIDLADVLWRSTYRTDPTTESLETLMDEALTSLSRFENDWPDALAGQAAILTGLVLRRRAERSVSNRLDVRWQPVPWLLVAVLLNPSDGYWSANLSWGLHGCGVDRQALFFAEEAYRLDEDKGYAQEAVIAARLNFFGMFDHATETLLKQCASEESWKWTVAMLEKLVAGRLDTVTEISREEAFDAPWGHQLIARVKALKLGFKAVESDFRALLDEARRPPVDWTVAAEFALLLGEPDRSRELIQSGQASGDVSEDEAQYAQAQVDLVTTGGKQGYDTMAQYLASEARPFTLLSAANADLPLLGAAHPHIAGLSMALEKLVGIARKRLALLKDLPPMTDGLDADPDTARRRLVSTLLDTIPSAQNGYWAAAATNVAQVAQEHKSGLMGTALRRLEAIYRASGAAAAGSTLEPA